MFCPKCGAKCEDDSRFCMSCGNAFAQQNAVIQSAPVQQVVKKESGFVERIKSDKLTLGLFCTSVMLLLVTIALAVMLIGQSADCTEKAGAESLSSNDLTGVWGMVEDEFYFVIYKDGSVKTTERANQDDNSWSIEGEYFVHTEIMGPDDDPWEEKSKFTYELKDDCLCLTDQKDGQDWNFYYVTSDTSLSYEEISEIFNEKYAHLLEEYNDYDEYYDDEYYDDEYYDDYDEYYE